MDRPCDHFVCIGFMGAGKSDRGAERRRADGTRAVDVDAVIEGRLGKPIAQAFDEDGEDAFRALEERTALELLDAPDGPCSRSAVAQSALRRAGCADTAPGHLA